MMKPQLQRSSKQHGFNILKFIAMKNTVEPFLQMCFLSLQTLRLIFTSTKFKQKSGSSLEFVFCDWAFVNAIDITHVFHFLTIII